jgi:hypothetical protein
MHATGHHDRKEISLASQPEEGKKGKGLMMKPTFPLKCCPALPLLHPFLLIFALFYMLAPT